jgi:hypothetical protein
MDSPIDDSTVAWLLAGDASIAYQTRRDLRGVDDPHLQGRIATSGWGAEFLKRRKPDGGWGRAFYQPKWTSTHYTLLDLRTLCMRPDHPDVRESIHLVALNEKAPDGGIAAAKTAPRSDVCVNGMFLNYAAYFGEAEQSLHSVVDYVLDQRMADGGFNCSKNRAPVRHSSMHSTISVAEGIAEYLRHGYRYRRRELAAAEASCREFLLCHRLFRSDHTGEVINEDFLRLPFPPRWHYTILRALDHFRAVGAPWDERMRDAVQVLAGRRHADGRWRRSTPYSGSVHFQMEAGRLPSRWITLIALRVLAAYPAV